MEKRSNPYMYVTWLAEHMVGNMMCDFKLWFRANHKDWIKPPNDFDVSGWQMAHTALLREIIGDARTRGQRLFIEDQGSFWQNWKGINISGKPDLVEIDDLDKFVTVWDAKTGKPSPTHQAQLQLYMHFLPLQYPSIDEYKFQGILKYSNHPDKFVEPADSSLLISSLDNACAVVLGETPFKTPSNHECGWCDIGSDNCDERIEP